MNKKRNNKGFSLVELIVVIAVMAVLVVVLAPAYLRYVDKARVQKDVSAISEVVQAIKIAAAEEDVADEIQTGTVVYVGSKGTVSLDVDTVNLDTDEDQDDSDLYKEIVATVGTSIDLSSSAFSGETEDAEAVKITITEDTNHNLSFVIDGPSAIASELLKVAPATPKSGS